MEIHDTYSDDEMIYRNAADLSSGSNFADVGFMSNVARLSKFKLNKKTRGYPHLYVEG